MSNARAAMVTMKENQIEGTLYINGQVVVGKCLFTVPEFAANPIEANTQHKREELLIDRALELNPEIALIRANKLFYPEYTEEDAAHD